MIYGIPHALENVATGGRVGWLVKASKQASMKGISLLRSLFGRGEKQRGLEVLEANLGVSRIVELQDNGRNSFCLEFHFSAFLSLFCSLP